MVGARVAVPCEERSPESRISPHLGRAPHIAVALVRDGEVASLEFIEAPAGRGSVPLLLLKLGVDVLICRGLGERARSLLESSGVRVIPGASGTVEEVLRALLSGELTPDYSWRSLPEYAEGRGCGREGPSAHQGDEEAGEEG